MTQLILTATAPQRKNLLALVGYLLSIKDTFLATQYDHGDEQHCSFGLGIRGKKIKALNGCFTVSDDGKDYKSRYTYRSNRDIADTVYGADYWKYIVYGPYNYDTKYICGEVESIPRGREQLVYVINMLIKAYAMTPQELDAHTPATVTKEVDTTKERIKARIKKLEKFLTYSETFAGDDTIDLTASVKAAQDDIKALKRALAV